MTAGTVLAVAQSPIVEDRDQLVTAGSDGSVMFWRCVDGEDEEATMVVEESERGREKACSDAAEES